MSFVGTKFVDSATELEQLIQAKINADPDLKCYYFLRWPHKVSGICQTRPQGFPGPEGQVFTSKWELRWKQQGRGFETLLLSDAEPDQDFQPLAFSADPEQTTWITKLRNAHFYPKDEIRFPRGFEYCKINVSQRYFIHEQTGSIHFVALTVLDEFSAS